MLAVASRRRRWRAPGGRVDYRFPADDPVFVTLRLGDSELGLGALGGAPLHGRPQRPATGHRIELCVEVTDRRRDRRGRPRAGTVVVLEPADQPWGERVAYLEDADGLAAATGADLAHRGPPPAQAGEPA